ncbi:hypothetical protein A3Q56_02021 [Intoshia linei]|uniref:Uncharacterized protein n=1 Tax=Intoshia linei TaxID=1819745 RepID=A0A177B7K9_9BILA|nr:hypothetical protein A3Q56_02021 [Intoshia linei]
MEFNEKWLIKKCQEYGQKINPHYLENYNDILKITKFDSFIIKEYGESSQFFYIQNIMFNLSQYFYISLLVKYNFDHERTNDKNCFTTCNYNDFSKRIYTYEYKQKIFKNYLKFETKFDDKSETFCIFKVFNSILTFYDIAVDMFQHFKEIVINRKGSDYAFTDMCLFYFENC